MIRWRPSGLQRQHAFFVLMAWVQRPFVSVSRAVWSVLLLAMSLYSTWHNTRHFSELASPVAYGIQHLERAWLRGLQWWRTRQDMQAEIDTLRQKIEALERGQQYHQFLQVENKHLKSMFHVVASISWTTQRVEVLAIPFERGASIMWVAAHNAMQPQQSVATDEGLVGRVDALNGNTARIRLITDGLSRLPVCVEGTTRELIVAGQNSAELVVLHQKEASDTGGYEALQVGMRLITARYHHLPPNIPVAVISRIEGQKIFAKPLAQFGRVHYVHMISGCPKPDDSCDVAEETPELP